MARPSKPLELSCRLRVLRAETGMTQEDLAEAVGVTRQTIIALEKDEYAPSLLLAYALARRFGKTVEEVFPVKD